MLRRIFFSIAMIGSVSRVLLAGDAGGQAEGRDARAVRPVRRRGREGRDQLRPAGLAPRAAGKCPRRHASEPGPAFLLHQHQRVEAVQAADRGQVRRHRHSGRCRCRERPAAGDRPDGRHARLRGGDSGGRPDHGDRRQVSRGDELRQGRRGLDRPPGHRRQADASCTRARKIPKPSRSPARSSISPASSATAASPTISGTS